MKPSDEANAGAPDESREVSGSPPGQLTVSRLDLRAALAGVPVAFPQDESGRPRKVRGRRVYVHHHVSHDDSSDGSTLVYVGYALGPQQTLVLEVDDHTQLYVTKEATARDVDLRILEIP